MKPSDLYEMPPSRISYDLYCLSEFLSEDLPDAYFNLPDPDDLKGELPYELRYYVDHSFDGRRFMQMISLWWHGDPVAIAQRAGREGRDYSQFVITDEKRYHKFLDWLRTHMEEEEEKKDPRVFDPDSNLDYLDHFYGVDVSSYYVPETVHPKYQVGDIVAARVPVNHLRYNSDKVITRCKISRVFPYNPSLTYHVFQMDRRWGDRSSSSGPSEMIFDEGNGGVGASLACNDVICLWSEYAEEDI